MGCYIRSCRNMEDIGAEVDLNTEGRAQEVSENNVSVTHRLLWYSVKKLAAFAFVQNVCLTLK